MYIIGITACTAGIAHTYIAKEKLEVAARELGHEVKIETQGSIGVENYLSEVTQMSPKTAFPNAQFKIGIGSSGIGRFSSGLYRPLRG